MKRKLYILLMMFGLVMPTLSLVSTPTADAVDLFHNICSGNNDSKTNAATTDVCKEKAGAGTGNPIVHAISVAIGVLSIIVGVSAVIVIMLSGFRMITSQGNPQSVAGARSAIIYALIGLAVAVIAGSIVAFVLSKL